MYKHPLLNRDKMSPQEALDILVEGNHRFVNNIASSRDMIHLASITKDKQHPFAAVLSCSDSRAPTELLFDQAIGDIFSVRLAGNIASDKAIGSIEFACKHLGTKLIVVLGHTNCGAVKAACDGLHEGHIGEIISLIRPAVRLEKSVENNRDSDNTDFVAKVCELNVRTQINEIIHTSDIVQDMLAANQIAIIGGVYNLSTGVVTFLQDSYKTSFV